MIISEQDLNNIYNILKNKSKLEIKNIIEKTYNEIKEELFKKDEELQKYIEKNINYIINVIMSALKTKTLDKVFIIEKILNI